MREQLSRLSPTRETHKKDGRERGWVRGQQAVTGPGQVSHKKDLDQALRKTIVCKGRRGQETKTRVQADVVRARDPESWEGGCTRIKGSTLAANGRQHVLLGCVAQPEWRATLSTGSVVSHRRDSKGDEASLRGEGEPVSVVSVSRRGPERESEVKASRGTP